MLVTRLGSLTVLAVLAACVGCGSSSGGSTQTTISTSTAAPAPRTHLVITVSNAGYKLSGTTTIDCPGETRCARLERTPFRSFAPVSRRAICTEQYGGDGTATIDGTLRGHPLHARYDLHNGCAIGRWARMKWLIGRPPVPPGTY